MTDPSASPGARRHIAGTAVSLGGNDIDTDRIIPGRFLKTVSFAGLEQHVFADERNARRDGGDPHPFDDPKRRAASLLLVEKNFGCGSSREHAPQALRRWGITAVIGESFGEIFAGNCVALGVPCLRVTAADAARLRDAAASDAARRFAIDLEEMTIRSGNLVVPVELPAGAHAQLLDGSWDATATLLAAGGGIERAASLLPYLNGWK
jgi:3-isopropylmalate/(R)-2-methylmalate dehydratase small subunit